MLGSRMIRIVAQCGLALVLVAATTACRGGAPRRADAANDDVLFIGDSIFALSFDIEENLEAQFQTTFRSYTASGARLSAAGVAPSVRSQFTSAERANPNSTVVVMNGGGNDLLFPVLMSDPQRCLTVSPTAALSATCTTLLNTVSMDLTNFLGTLRQGGVTDVIYLGYYFTKNAARGGLTNGAPLGQLRQAVDFSAMALAQACARVQTATFRCTFLDTRSAILPADIVADGVHPNPAGSRKLSDLIAPRLQPLL